MDDTPTSELRKANRFGFQTLSFFIIISMLVVVVFTGPFFAPSMTSNSYVSVNAINPTTASSSRLNRSDLFNVTIPHVPKVSQLHLLISITSGPKHLALRMAARESWLIPCMQSPVCDYRFFCDVVEGNVTDILAMEHEVYDDMVFRGPWCRFMHERHHPSINYGNYMEGFGAEKLEIPLPDYPLRLLYKVDWKVCFTKWAVLYDKVALYHAYVEDDSFNCVDNLLHQVQILHTLNTSTITTVTNNNSNSNSSSNKNGLILPVPPLRAGYPMWDGFDDSSTFMSREIVLVFATHYPSPGFNCTEIADATDKHKGDWLSWGNSWAKKRCGWRPKVEALLGRPLVKPKLVDSDPKLLCSKNASAAGSRRLLYAPLPCTTFGSVITHHGMAGEKYLSDANVAHMCEYTFFVDKVKHVGHMKDMWRLVHALITPTYHDFTPVLLRDDDKGWPLVVKAIEESEKICKDLPIKTSNGSENNSTIVGCSKWRRSLRENGVYGESGLREDTMLWGHWPDPGIRVYYGSIFD